MRRLLLGFGIAALAIGGADRAEAQFPVTTVYETVSPGYKTVTYGERVKVRRGLFKTVIKQKPVAYVTRTPPVVRETRYVQPAPVCRGRGRPARPGRPGCPGPARAGPGTTLHPAGPDHPESGLPARTGDPDSLSDPVSLIESGLSPSSLGRGPGVRVILDRVMHEKARDGGHRRAGDPHPGPLPEGEGGREAGSPLPGKAEVIGKSRSHQNLGIPVRPPRARGYLRALDRGTKEGLPGRCGGRSARRGGMSFHDPDATHEKIGRIRPDLPIGDRGWSPLPGRRDRQLRCRGGDDPRPPLPGLPLGARPEGEARPLPATSTMKGGESGPAIVPGKPEESLFWEHVEADEMPPKAAAPRRPRRPRSATGSPRGPAGGPTRSTPSGSPPPPGRARLVVAPAGRAARDPRCPATRHGSGTRSTPSSSRGSKRAGSRPPPRPTAGP